MAVYSTVEGVDAVGACVGQNGARVDAIVNELNGEKIDVIPWSDMYRYIRRSQDLLMYLLLKFQKMKRKRVQRLLVLDNQLSLAIGKEGQNARLSAKLTGWRIDIKSESQARATDFIDFDSVDAEDEE